MLGCLLVFGVYLIIGISIGQGFQEACPVRNLRYHYVKFAMTFLWPLLMVVILLEKIFRKNIINWKGLLKIREE